MTKSLKVARILLTKPSAPQIPVLRELGVYQADWNKPSLEQLSEKQLKLLISILPKKKKA